MEFSKHFEEEMEGIEISSHPDIKDQLRIHYVDEFVRKWNHHDITNENFEKCKRDYARGNYGLFDEYFRATKIAILDSTSRLNIASRIIPEDPRRNSYLPLLQLISAQPYVQSELQKVFSEAFNMNIILDYYTPGVIHFKVGTKEQLDLTKIPSDYEGIKSQLNDLRSLDDQGDGFRIFVGIVMGVLVCNNRILLIDEPEAFLHSTQAKVLGRWLADYSSRANNQLVVATHSSDILDGMTGNSGMNIVRMDRNDGITTFRSLTDMTISQLNRDPLLSNLPILESIFYHGVILTEGDRDRLVYRAAYRSLLRQDEDYLFINTNGKQALKRIVPLLININSRFRVVTDFDMILNKQEFHQLIRILTSDNDVSEEIINRRDELEVLFYKESEDNLIAQIFQDMKSYIEKTMNSQVKSLYTVQENVRSISKITQTRNIKKKGIEAFSEEEREKVNLLLNDGLNNNLFIVPYGEIESLIPWDVSKENWLEPALDEIYLKKPQSRLQEFISDIFAGLQ